MRLRYLANYRAAHRPSPSVEPQASTDLPPFGEIVFSADGRHVQCHVCGKWYKALNTHHRVHGLDGDSYRETYGLSRTASLWPPELQAIQRQLALDRDQGSIGRANIPPSRGRQPGIEARLSTRIAASCARKGINFRTGGKTKT